MGSYAGQLNAGDRWRVALYVMEAFKGGAISAPVVAATEPATASKESATGAAASSVSKKNKK